MDIVARAIPFFLLAISVEFVWSQLKRQHFYRLNDSISDLNCGILDQIFSIPLHAVMFWLYVKVFENYSLTHLQPSPLTWLGAFLLLDFLYYWFHRSSHRVNIIWATHIVHHSSEEYNLTVALRQGALQTIFSHSFYLVMAWVGFPLEMMVTVFSFNLIYQFWFHTRFIKNMGFFELFMNTPSHHRVHHGINPKYIDKNYAGVFIIWDKMFGTFEKETEEPVYGITAQLNSWNPLQALLHHWIYLWQTSRKTNGVLGKLQIWFKPPEWKPSGIQLSASEEVPILKRTKYNSHPGKVGTLYAVFNFVLAAAIVSGVLIYNQSLDPRMTTLLLIFSGLTILIVGLTFDKNKMAVRTECLRIAFIGAAVIWRTSLIL